MNMANKQVFTAFDVYGYKKALALWAAKNNALIEKWSKALADVQQDIEQLYEYKPSSDRDWRIRAKELVRNDIQIFLDDLRTPCDSFISEFEWKNACKENG